MARRNKTAHWSDGLPMRVRHALNYVLHEETGRCCIRELPEREVARVAAKRDLDFWRSLPNIGKHTVRELQHWLASHGRPQ